MITHIERNNQDSLGLLAISQNIKLNGMGQQESQGALCFFADVHSVGPNSTLYPASTIQDTDIRLSQILGPCPTSINIMLPASVSISIFPFPTASIFVPSAMVIA